MLRILGVHMQQVTPLPSLDNSKGSVLIANHRSMLDIPVLLSLYPDAHFVSRHDLAHWPLIGRGAREAGVIFVDRQNPLSGQATIAAMRDALKQKQRVIIFPEGGAVGDDQLKPFRRGIWVAAQDLDVNWIAAGLAYPPDATFGDRSIAKHLMQISKRPSTAVSICIDIHHPPDAQTHSPEQGAAQGRDHVQRLVSQARNHWKGHHV